MGEENVSFDKAKKRALDILARRAYTKKELTDKLVRYEIDRDIASEAVLWAEEYGFVNDEEYARAYASECVNSKKYGMRRVKQALAYKGIDPNTIEDVLCELEIDEKEKLLPLVEKKLAGNFERKNTDKTIRYFMNKGYSFSDIRSAIEQVKDDTEFMGRDDFEL